MNDISAEEERCAARFAPMRAVTISREDGSGGEEIAALLALRIGWSLVDRQIAAQVARALNETEAEAARRDEHVCGFFDRLVDALQWTSPLIGWQWTQMPIEEAERQHRDATCRLVRAAVQIGQVVIVGRGAQVLLAGRRDVLRLRVVAPLDRRVDAVAQRDGVSAEAARASIQRMDRARNDYVRSLEHRRLDDPMLYDLIINTGTISVEQAAALAAHALRSKAEQLAAETSRPTLAGRPDRRRAEAQELWIRRF